MVEKSVLRNVCERCLTISTDKECPLCGYKKFSKMVITVQNGKSKKRSRMTSG